MGRFSAFPRALGVSRAPEATPDHPTPADHALARIGSHARPPDAPDDAPFCTAPCDARGRARCNARPDPLARRRSRRPYLQSLESVSFSSGVVRPILAGLILTPLCWIVTSFWLKAVSMTAIYDTRTDPEWLEELGRRLRALRKSQRRTIVDVAREAGLDRETVSRAERGDNPTLLTLVRLLRVHGRLNALEDFIPEPLPSPLEALGKRYERGGFVRGPHGHDEPGSSPRGSGKSPGGDSGPRGSGESPGSASDLRGSRKSPGGDSSPRGSGRSPGTGSGPRTPPRG